MKGILECCVDSVESAIAAKNGGADRLELCQGLVIGGVTPGTALFQEIKNQMDIRIHALMREHLYTPEPRKDGGSLCLISYFLQKTVKYRNHWL